MRNYNRKIYYFFLIVIVIGVVFLDKNGWLDKPKSVGYGLVTPVQGIIYRLTNNSSVFVKDLFSFSQLKEERDELRLVSDKLLATEARLKEIDSENDFLRKQLGISMKLEYSLVMANVVGSGANINYQKIIIDKGFKDSVKEGDAVITAGGILIGKIIKTYPNRSEAVLVNNPESSIPVLLQDSRAQGVLRGEYGTGIVLDFVPAENNIMAGEKIVTLAMDNIPHGLLVGEVGEIINQSGGLFKKAIVNPASVLKNIDKVFLIIK